MIVILMLMIDAKDVDYKNFTFKTDKKYDTIVIAIGHKEFKKI